jgi:hypothetical protein
MVRLLASTVFVLVLAVGLSGEPARAAGGPPDDGTLPEKTLYLTIPLGIPGVPAQTTGIFIPAGYKVGDAVDLVLFLRGYDINRPKTATSVKEYWGSPDHPVLRSFLLREEINKSGKNVIMVVPTLGPVSDFGELKEEGGVQKYLASILEGLEKEWGRKPLRVRNIILAAHSGGGVPLRRLAQVLGNDPSYKRKLKECWGFDSIYGVRDKDAEFWSGWASEHPEAKVSMFYIFTERAVGKDPKQPVSATNPLDHREPNNTSGPALELERIAKAQKLNNVVVVRETKDSTPRHNEVPLAHLAKLLSQAAYLEDR